MYLTLIILYHTLMNSIKNLIDNHPECKDPQIIDVILESGAANGSYHLGCMMYIYGLEQKKIIKIDRISGSSIGAIIALYYFTNTLDDFFHDYKKLRECFKNKLNVAVLKKIIEDKIEKINDVLFNKIKKKLFIVYHSVNEKKQIVKTNFKDKNELLMSILKSSHIPYITDTTFFLEDNKDFFFDGGIPHIFSERNNKQKILYIQINNFQTVTGFFSVRKEKNNFGRFLKGSLDAHQLFLYKKPGVFCSYINDWYFFDFLFLRFKQIIMTIIFFIFIFLNYTLTFLWPFIIDFPFVQNLTTIFINIYRDFILFYCL